jgi:hypothetical protein
MLARSLGLARSLVKYVRGYLTFRLLQQAGFDVVNLDGKFKKTIRGGYPALIASEVPKPLR